jgi:RNA polymerase sigma-70 factor (ECF subfamily)
VSESLSQILKKAQNGNSKAQMEFYEATYKAIFNSCIRILSNREDAEDITHDTFIHVYDKKVLIPEETNLLAWIRRVGINKSIDFLRRKHKIQITDKVNEHLNSVSEDTNEIEKSIDPKAVIEAINQLPQQYRIILSLYLIEGYDHTEISEILKINNSSSRAHYARAKVKLKSILIQELSA